MQELKVFQVIVVAINSQILWLHVEICMCHTEKWEPVPHRIYNSLAPRHSTYFSWCPTERQTFPCLCNWSEQPRYAVGPEPRVYCSPVWSEGWDRSLIWQRCCLQGLFPNSVPNNCHLGSVCCHVPSSACNNTAIKLQDAYNLFVIFSRISPPASCD